MLFRSLTMGPLMDEAADGSGGGGAATTPAPLTLEAIQAMFTTGMNAFETKFEQRLKALAPKPATATAATGTGHTAGAATTTPATAATTAAAAAAATTAADPFAREKAEEHDTRLKALEEENRTTKLNAQRIEMEAEIKNSLSGFEWDKDADGRSVAFDYFKAKAGRNEGGELVVNHNGAEFQLPKFITEAVPRTFKNFLAARNIGGAGAPGKTAAQGKAGSAELESIKPGMNKEADDAVRAGILHALNNR